MLRLLHNAQFRDYLGDGKIRMQCSGNFFSSCISIDVNLSENTIEDISIDDKAEYVNFLDNLDYTVKEASSWSEFVELIDANILETARQNYADIFKEESETLAEYCIRLRTHEFVDADVHTIASFLEENADDSHADGEQYTVIFSDGSVAYENDSDEGVYSSIKEYQQEVEMYKKEWEAQRQEDEYILENY